MCDYSLQSVKSRPAKVGDQLTTHQFNIHTRGFCASEDGTLAFVCYREPSCPSRRKLGVRVNGCGVRAVSITRPQSFGRSIRTIQAPITTLWNSQMARSFC